VLLEVELHLRCADPKSESERLEKLKNETEGLRFEITLRNSLVRPSAFSITTIGSSSETSLSDIYGQTLVKPWLGVAERCPLFLATGNTRPVLNLVSFPEGEFTVF